MITLYTFGPRFGLPDMSPFVTKAELLLRMAQLRYETSTKGMRGAPKGKLPYISDDGVQIADSTFIRWYLEKAYGIDFDRGLDAEARAIAWAFEKMAEDQLYWVAVDIRWLDDENFKRGYSRFFDEILPAPVRPLAKTFVRHKIRKQLAGQGMGRHSRDERMALGIRSVEAISDFLGTKPFFMGPEPTGIDATMFAFVAGVLCPLFPSPLQEAAAGRRNLADYVTRMGQRFYPEYPEIAGCRLAPKSPVKELSAS